MLVVPEPTAAEKLEELVKCRQPGGAGFIYFCETYCWIQDKVRKREVPFELFAGQRRVAVRLCLGKWLWILKGRQLGFTWLIAAYTLWRMIHDRMFTAFNFQQSKDYAKDFISRVRFMLERLPRWMQPRIGTDATDVLEFPYRQARIRALAAGRSAARSLTADLGVYDEAAFIDEFDETMGAALPALTGAAEGQIVILSTSAGPGDMFHTGWQVLQGETDLFDEEDDDVQALTLALEKFEAVFVHWSERPGRDENWYERQRAVLRMFGEHHIKREYPNTPQEAFAYAEGRIYPFFFRETHTGVRDESLALRRVRAIDWGGSEGAHVCLWIAEFEGPPALLIHPHCRHTIREHLNWRRVPKGRPNAGKPMDRDDHTCDALRYAIATFNMRRSVYVYRERYIRNAVAKGWTEPKHIKDIHERSGWVEVPQGEGRSPYRAGPDALPFSGSVADRSRNDSIALYNENGIPVIGHRRPSPASYERKQGRTADSKPDEIEEGIMLVQALIDGTLQLVREADPTPEKKVLDAERKRAALPVRVSPASTDEAVIAWRLKKQAEARRQLRKQQR